MKSDELRANAAECYAFARSVGAPDLADALDDLGRAFESAAAEMDAAAAPCGLLERFSREFWSDIRKQCPRCLGQGDGCLAETIFDAAETARPRSGT